MTLQLTWFEASRDLKAGDRVVFCRPWDVFPEAAIPEGAKGTVTENGLNDLACLLLVKPDDAALQTALKEWDGDIHLAPPLDRDTGNREPAWQEPSPVAKVPMSFEEFQATGRYYDDLRPVLNDNVFEEDETLPVKGNVYLGAMYIDEVLEHWPDECKAAGKWHLVLDRSEFISDDLEELERKLYEFAVDEGYTVTIEQLAEAAKPLNEDEWGSERQIRAQNVFFNAVEQKVSPEVFDALDNYCMKANVYDMIAAGLQAVRGERDFAEYRRA